MGDHDGRVCVPVKVLSIRGEMGTPGIATVRRIYFDANDGDDVTLEQFAGYGFQHSYTTQLLDFPKSTVLQVAMQVPLVSCHIELEGSRVLHICAPRPKEKPMENDATKPNLGHTLAEKLMTEIARVRDEVMPAYLLAAHRGNNTAPALALMREEMDKAIRALAESDAVQCLESYGTLKGFAQ